MAFYLITSNIHIIVESWQAFWRKRSSVIPKSLYLPTVTVLIPAHNEELCIEATLASLCESVYPPSKLSITVINDGSTDDTANLVKKFIKNYHGNIRVRLLNQRNKGKAAALNRALRSYVKSTLVFCIDADSKVDPRAIRLMAQHFRDKRIIGASSNVNIIEDGTLLGLSQRFEYMMGYQMKRTETFCNIEYIIGGVGSMFRYKALRDVGLYDTNTQTEDIDLTMKLINKFGNKNVRLIHVAEALTYTQPVSTMKALVAQRLRWKYGRWQTFFKHGHLFFN
jgi:cellulose synthase/poly-beta-1,6-N-acetylglucosamine synthase-like glycosyltransferase